tara:strand:+ start:130 stop:471 length:342 start_codon:yes stop_codon:yes gene_type:complete
MKITKKLKYAEFEWDEESKSFMITEDDGNRVILNKVYAFAFMRFVIRMAQRNWYRKPKEKVLNNYRKHGREEPVELADHPFENPDQLKFEEVENEELYTNININSNENTTIQR